MSPMARTLTIALVQENPVIGAMAANRARLLEHVARERTEGTALVLFPELATIGYPPRDLLTLPGFVEENLATVQALAAQAQGIRILVGHVDINRSARGKGLTNACSLLEHGQVVHTWRKALLPSYDVFDEARYFEPGQETTVVDIEGWRVGVTICEDIWTDPEGLGRPIYQRDPAREQIALGVDLLVNVSASPYAVEKLSARRQVISHLARAGSVPVVYCNQVGANDELVFDGGSFVVDGAGRLVAQAPQFEAAVTRWTAGEDHEEVPAPQEGLPAVLSALELGLRDYLRKCGFSSVCMGLSGGIDSAVTCAIAVRALGPDRVVGLLMPSPFSSDHSLEDARALAENLGIAYHELPISNVMDAYESTLSPHFQGTDPDVTEENIQARIRGNLLMAWSNKFGHLVLSTGNKSELAVGYCTLYGDMAGGLALISDVPKMMVYALADLVNRDGVVIPRSTIEKPPSAELRLDQRDADSLPPYPVLDAIIQAYVEQRRSAADIVADGHDLATVERVLTLIHRNEYKRRQAAPGIKVTSKAFGSGRRFPMAHERG